LLSQYCNICFRSVAVCYRRQLRLLRASVVNNSRVRNQLVFNCLPDVEGIVLNIHFQLTQMDRAFERIINVVFYFVVVCVVLSVVGIDPLVLFASISGFVLGFAFMIGAACSKYFEGLLLILVRRPYGKCRSIV
jgi:small-conductance mechanosensitive channel